MEDISRELEREIARAKPSPYKADRKKKVLVIDDFGEFKSGGYLKVLVYIFSVVSLIGVAGTVLFYYLYSNASSENTQLKESLAVLEKKTSRLTNDKEILMARLVMSGEKPELAPPVQESKQGPPAKEKQAGIMAKPESVKEEPKAPPAEEPPVEPAPPEIDESTEEQVTETKPNVQEEEKPAVTNQVVSVEKFSVTQGKSNEQLVVRFNIRNIAQDSKEISGRIFAVLKPEAGPETDWVVVPNASLENGMPSPYRKGQYFSISRFKPVRFTINNHASPDSFANATIYIFGDDASLLFENTIKINGNE